MTLPADRGLNHPARADYDVIVVGSGSAALAAALVTAHKGLSTLILEKAAVLGGTTALSGGGTWIPATHHAREAGIEDSPDAAFDYINAVCDESWRATEAPLWRRFVDEGPKAIAFIEQSSPLRFQLTDDADPWHDAPGARSRGRMMVPLPLSAWRIWPHSFRLRAAMLPQIATFGEIKRYRLFNRPVRGALRIWYRIVWRFLSNTRTNGMAMVIGLLRGCLDGGAEVLTKARAVNLLRNDAGNVTGVEADIAGARRTIGARHGVVLATGGFEWDRARLARHFPGPIDFITSPRTNAGDGHRMAEAAGAALVHMDQANIGPGLPIHYDGQWQGLSHFFHREPNLIIVDRNGKRFGNEFTFNLGEWIDARDESGMPLHLPAWAISDSRLLANSPLVRLFLSRKSGWLKKADTIESLAEQIGVPEDALKQSVGRFNAAAAAGEDLEFHRHMARGEKLHPVSAYLQPIDRPPYLALPFNRSFVSTKGGPRTDAYGRVLRTDGSTIGGLYCAGVAMANPIGTRTVGTGTTIGPNLTWGYICGQSIVAAAQTDRA